MQLKDYLDESHIIPDLIGENKIEIIKELMHRMHDLQLVSDFEMALDDVLAREGNLSTGLDNGLAIPHAKTDGTDKLVIVFGLKKGGVDFETLDGKPAQFIFLVLSPKDTSGPHIQALALISRNLKEKETRDILIKASTAKEIINIFENFA